MKDGVSAVYLISKIEQVSAAADQTKQIQSRSEEILLELN